MDREQTDIMIRVTKRSYGMAYELFYDGIVTTVWSRESAEHELKKVLDKRIAVCQEKFGVLNLED